MKKHHIIIYTVLGIVLIVVLSALATKWVNTGSLSIVGDVSASNGCTIAPIIVDGKQFISVSDFEQAIGHQLTQMDVSNMKLTMCQGYLCGEHCPTVSP